jgi:hypothetical protein
MNGLGTIDRPGTTLGPAEFRRSSPVPMPRAAADAVADLHTVLPKLIVDQVARVVRAVRKGSGTTG